MASDTILHALVVHTSDDEVEALIKVIRNSGYALRVTHVEDVEDMLIEMEEKSFEVVFSAMEVFEGSIEQVADALSAKSSTSILLALMDELDTEEVTAAMLAGARDAVSHVYPQHLEMVIKRELTAFRTGQDSQRWYRAYQDNESRLRVLLDTSRDAITYVHEGMHIYANPAYLKLFGFASFEEIEGTPVMDMVKGGDQQKLKERLRAVRGDSGQSQSAQLAVTAIAGDREFSVSMEFAPASYEEESCTQITIHDHTLQRELAAKVRDLKKFDQLTDLLNRTAFATELTRKAKAPQGWGLLFIDLDSVRALRNTLGISGLDRFLKQFAGVVKHSLPNEAVIGRFADFTLAAILSVRDAVMLGEIAEMLRGAVEAKIFDIDGKSVTATASIGGTLLANCEEGSQQAIDAVERASANARGDGGNAVQLVNPKEEFLEGDSEDKKWVLAIRAALKANRFRLWYQPVGSLMGDSEEQYDALVRMLNDKDDPILPSVFMPVAESNGLTSAIDRWVIANALNVIAHRRRARHKTRMFVELSGPTFQDKSLMEWVAARVAAFKVAPDSLVLTAAAEDAATYLRDVAEVLKAASNLGLRFALKNFNGEPNQLQALKHLRVDYVRIDQSVVGNLPDEDAVGKLEQIVAQLEPFKTTLIADGVDDTGALPALWKYKIQLIKGDFLQEASDQMNFDFVGEVV